MKKPRTAKPSKRIDAYQVLGEVDRLLKNSGAKRKALVRAALALVFVQSEYKDEFEDFLSGKRELTPPPTKAEFMAMESGKQTKKTRKGA